MSNLNGVLLIDKPKEFTSFDVIAVVRRLTGQKKLGHTGTLDPNATGVLPVLLGTATKTQDLILNHDKSYTAEFQLGKTTDTLDIWGTVTGECESSVTEEQLRRVIPPFGLCNHFRRGIRRLDVCRCFYDVLGDQSRSGSHLQHCFVFHDRTDQLIYFFVCCPVFSHKAVIQTCISVPEILACSHCCLSFYS